MWKEKTKVVYLENTWCLIGTCINRTRLEISYKIFSTISYIQLIYVQYHSFQLTLLIVTMFYRNHRRWLNWSMNWLQIDLSVSTNVKCWTVTLQQEVGDFTVFLQNSIFLRLIPSKSINIVKRVQFKFRRTSAHFGKPEICIFRMELYHWPWVKRDCDISARFHHSISLKKSFS